MGRIRKALGRPAQRPSATPGSAYEGLPELGQVMPPIALGDLVPKFEAELQKLAGSTYRASTRQELDGILRSILDSCQVAAVVLSRNPLIAQLGLVESLRAWGKSVAVWPDAGAEAAGDDTKAFREECFSAAVGITGVDFVLAETGTLVLTSHTEGSQLASLAPPVQVALYRRGQVFASLEEILDRLLVSGDAKQPTPGRSVVFVTGTSRTADIEQIIIRGVHGPGQVHAILVEDSCLTQHGVESSA